MIIYLDRQHSGKPSPGKVADLGARSDLDADGVIVMLEREAMLTGYISLHAEARLRERGHDVIPISDGWYSARHERVNAYSQNFPDDLQVYVALHLNAFMGIGAEYGAVFYDHRSRKGPALAGHVGRVLGDIADELDSVKVIKANPTKWANAYATISGVSRPVGLLYEPCFMDNSVHTPLLEAQGLRRLGAALAEGLHAWSLHENS